MTPATEGEPKVNTTVDCHDAIIFLRARYRHNIGGGAYQVGNASKKKGGGGVVVQNRHSYI